MCRSKTNNGGGLYCAAAHNWKHSDKVRIDAMDKEIENYEQVLQENKLFGGTEREMEETQSQ